MNDAIIAFLGAIIGAAIVTIGEWVRMRFQLKENRYLRELDDLNKLYDTLSNLLKSGMSSITSFDKEKIKNDVYDHYHRSDDTEIQTYCIEIANNHEEVLFFYLQNRHILTKTIREECDKTYSNFVNLRSSLLNVNDLTTEDRKKFVISYYTLSGLMYLGILKKMEFVSNKLYPLASKD